MAAFTKSGHTKTFRFAGLTSRFRPRLCRNARNFDANGTAHHIGIARVQVSVLMPTLTRHALKFRPQLPPTFTNLSFYTASATSGQSRDRSTPS